MFNKLSSVISGCISCKLQQKVTWGGWISGPSMFEIIKKLNQMVMAGKVTSITSLYSDKSVQHLLSSEYF